MSWSFLRISFRKTFGFQLSQTTTHFIHYFIISTRVALYVRFEYQNLLNSNVVQYRIRLKIQKLLQFYYRSKFKIQNALALNLHKCLHVICCIYDLDTKTASNQNVFKTKVAQNFKIFSFITYYNFTFVHPHKYLCRIHPINNSDTETSLRQKKLNTNISKNFIAYILKHHMHLKKLNIIYSALITYWSKLNIPEFGAACQRVPATN